jgi:hypothetical protein
VGRIVSDEVLAVLTDPYETMTRMDLKHRETRVVQFTSDLWTPEQAMLLDDWWDPRTKSIKCRDTVIAKGRNQGVGWASEMGAVPAAAALSVAFAPLIASLGLIAAGFAAFAIAGAKDIDAGL